MDYHHRDGTSTKLGNVSCLKGSKRTAEAAKCDLICAVCHAEETHTEMMRNRKQACSTDRRVYWRNHDYVRARKLEDEGCESCYVTIQDTEGLFSYFEYDHRDPRTKIASISRLCSQRVSLTRIKSELEKCRLLCRPCHRRRSTAQLTIKEE